MIICNSHNFAVTRAPKTGGTSLELYILESGLVDTATDTYALEGGFSTWQEFKAYSDAHDNLNYMEIKKDLWGEEALKDAQTTFLSLVEQGRVQPDMPCIGGIRHPLEWLASLYYYANTRNRANTARNIKEHGKPSEYNVAMEAGYGEPDASWDLVFRKIDNLQYIKDILRPQTSYYPEHVTFFNIENLHEHVSNFIVSKGGPAPTERMQARISSNDPTYYLDNLSADRKQRTLEIYEKDLIAWEKAHAKFN